MLWDCIHSAVARSSSYENLQPLYGHFTEPYPKFTLKLDIKRLEQVTEEEEFYSLLLSKLSDFHYLESQHSYDALNCSPDKVVPYIQALRSRNFDIRTHETNRAIKQGMFKPCYPFSLHSQSKNYVVWREKGKHSTGDLIKAVE